MNTYNRRGIKSLIFIDGGDPQETAEAKKILGFIDGQTTNPTQVLYRFVYFFEAKYG